ncbi:hypothetical protein ACFWNL_36525 [Kitasatospora sp. NPDC058397]|uniref:hypothetical protein n=1 Tax=unclassified Kitasatospora TaxID=2633591 RepID=UPI0036591BD6
MRDESGIVDPVRVWPVYGESLARLRRVGVRIAEFATGAYSWTRVLELLVV